MVLRKKKVNFAQSIMSTKKRSSYDISTKIKAIEFAIDTTSGHDAKLSLVGSALLRAGHGHPLPGHVVYAHASFWRLFTGQVCI